MQAVEERVSTLEKVLLFKKFYPEYEDKREWEYMDILNFDELGKNRGSGIS